MDKDRNQTALTLGLVLSMAALVFPAAQAIGANPPNIVVIMTDDQRADETALAMPNTLALIADQGVRYTRSIVHAPLCAPSRATFLTGQYAHNHGVLANQTPYGYPALDHSNTLAVWLQAAGYHTIFVDKYLNGYGEEDLFEIPPGWSDWRAALTLSYYQYFVNFNGVLSQYGTEPQDYRTDVMADHAVAAIKEAPADKPYFLWLATMAPHEDLCDTCGDEPTPAPRHNGAFDNWMPETLPPSFNEADVSDKPAYISTQAKLNKTDRLALLHKERKRMETLLAVDDLVERVVNAVAARGDLAETVFVFTSDNGYMMGEHRIDQFFKKVPYEESLGVPLYVRGPGILPGTTQTQLVSNQDLAGTIAALAGATPGIAQDGLDIRTVTSDRAVYLYNVGQKGPPAYDGVRTSKWVYLNYETGEQELYNLRVDPFQLESRHADPAYATIKAKLHEILLGLRDCAGATCNVDTRP